MTSPKDIGIYIVVYGNEISYFGTLFALESPAYSVQNHKARLDWIWYKLSIVDRGFPTDE